MAGDRKMTKTDLVNLINKRALDWRATAGGGTKQKDNNDLSAASGKRPRDYFPEMVTSVERGDKSAVNPVHDGLQTTSSKRRKSSTPQKLFSMDALPPMSSNRTPVKTSGVLPEDRPQREPCHETFRPYQGASQHVEASQYQESSQYPRFPYQMPFMPYGMHYGMSPYMRPPHGMPPHAMLPRHMPPPHSSSPQSTHPSAASQESSPPSLDSQENVHDWPSVA